MPGVKKVRYEKTCDECGNPFVASMKNARFCSSSCKARWNRNSGILKIKLNAAADVFYRGGKATYAFSEEVFRSIINKTNPEDKLNELYITDKYKFVRDRGAKRTEIAYRIESLNSQVVGNNDKSTKSPPM